MSLNHARSRSTLFARLALVGILTATGVTTAVVTARATETGSSAEVIQDKDWVSGINTKYRQLFDAPAPGGGIALVHMMNYMDTYNSAFKVPDKDITAIGTFYGTTTFHGLNDAMWKKYGLSAFLAGAGADAGKGASDNPWRSAPDVLGMSLPAASIEALQKRGAKFILCNNALTIFSGMVAKSKGLEANAVYADMKANILPGVTLVPAMVIAIEQSHKAGISYHKQ